MLAYHEKDMAPAASVPFIDAAGAMFGFMPNLHKILAESPAARSLFDALQTGGLEDQPDPG